MITLRHYRDGTRVDGEEFDPDAIEGILADEGSVLWIDVDDPTDEEIHLLEQRFKLHPLAIEDTHHLGQRPKVEIYGDHMFVVLQALHLADGDELERSEIHAFAGTRFLITLRYKPGFDLDPVLRRVDGRSDLAGEGPAYLLYVLLDEVVDDYFSIIDRFEDLGDEVEDRVFSEAPTNELQQTIYHLKRQIVEFRRFVLPLREVVDLMQELPGFVNDRMLPYYRDVADHVIRTLEFIDVLRDLLTSSMEAELSQVSNALNQTMKRVTSYGAILLVPTLIAGVYGMNFRHMPELGWGVGYPAALLMIVGSMVGLYLWFKRKGYL